jgi:hypothetical protein
MVDLSIPIKLGRRMVKTNTAPHLFTTKISSIFILFSNKY